MQLHLSAEHTAASTEYRRTTTERPDCSVAKLTYYCLKVTFFLHGKYKTQFVKKKKKISSLTFAILNILECCNISLIISKHVAMLRILNLYCSNGAIVSFHVLKVKIHRGVFNFKICNFPPPPPQQVCMFVTYDA